MQITTIGLDIAKQVFQVHGVDSVGRVMVRRRLRRSELLAWFGGLSPCLVGIESCATAHHWARELIALGHDVRLMPPAYVKPYVKRNKNDASDAEAICEAVTRPSMRFVAVKAEEQQAVLMLHRTRALLVRQRIMLGNALRAHCAELGVIVPKGMRHANALAAAIVDGTQCAAFPDIARAALAVLARQLQEIGMQLRAIERRLLAWHRQSEVSRRLATIPGVGPVTASAIAATVGDAGVFSSGRGFAAWLGLVPRQNSSAGKDRLGRISKQGDRYIRRLLVAGAVGVLRYARAGKTPHLDWLRPLLARRPAKVAAVALANKTARIAWALMVRQQTFRRMEPAIAA